MKLLLIVDIYETDFSRRNNLQFYHDHHQQRCTAVSTAHVPLRMLIRQE